MKCYLEHDRILSQNQLSRYRHRKQYRPCDRYRFQQFDKIRTKAKEFVNLMHILMGHRVEGLGLIDAKYCSRNAVLVTVRNHFYYVHQYFLDMSVRGKAFLGLKKIYPDTCFSQLFRALDITL